MCLKIRCDEYCSNFEKTGPETEPGQAGRRDMTTGGPGREQQLARSDSRPATSSRFMAWHGSRCRCASAPGWPPRLAHCSGQLVPVISPAPGARARRKFLAGSCCPSVASSRPLQVVVAASLWRQHQ